MCGICSSKILHFQVVPVVVHVVLIIISDVVFLSVGFLILNRDKNSIFVAASVC